LSVRQWPKVQEVLLAKSGLKDREFAGSQEASDRLPVTDRDGEAIADYDPLVAPEPMEWLALDEQERIDLIEDYHRRAGIRVPRATAHAVIHVVVENQIAEGDALPVQRTLQRLMGDGLDRHEAIHAIGSVLAAHMNDLVREARSNASHDNSGSSPDPNLRYFAELERLTAEKWRRSA
jgi:hypothetical protein